MRRLIMDVSKWACFLHRVNRDLPLAATDDGPEPRFADELFARLYGEDGEALPEGLQDPRWKAWAQTVHDTATALPAFERLAGECRGDADAAASAVEALLDELRSSMGAPREERDMRKLLRAGVAGASTAISELKDAMFGLEHLATSPGGRLAASGPGASGEQLARLRTRLRSDPGFRRIAMMAGRFRRILQGKRRSRVKRGSDEISDVVLGGDVGRLLASSLVGLNHPKLRLITLAAITERRALQYQLRGHEALGKGPMIVLLDRSSSMEEGQKNPWSLAAVLALHAHAMEDRRSFMLLGFTEVVVGEVLLNPGEPLPAEAVHWPCSGGTDISAAVDRALHLRSHQASLARADLILISDGASDPAAASTLVKRAHEAGVVILGLAIEVPTADLRPWADHVEPVGPLDTMTDSVASALVEGA